MGAGTRARPCTLRIENRPHRQRARGEQKAMTVCCCMFCSPTRDPVPVPLILCSSNSVVLATSEQLLLLLVLLLPIGAGGPKRGVRLTPHWSRLWESGATTPGNMPDALEHRGEGAPARDTVELQTLLVMCFLETFTALPQV